MGDMRWTIHPGLHPGLSDINPRASCVTPVEAQCAVTSSISCTPTQTLLAFTSVSLCEIESVREEGPAHQPGEALEQEHPFSPKNPRRTLVGTGEMEGVSPPLCNCQRRPSTEKRKNTLVPARGSSVRTVSSGDQVHSHPWSAHTLQRLTVALITPGSTRKLVTGCSGNNERSVRVRNH